jgi:hypothetical protein
MVMRTFVLLALAACGGASGPGAATVTLRPACGVGEYWDGRACQKAGDGPGKLEAGMKALAELKIDDAKAALDAAEKAGPLDHEHDVTLWEQRGIAAAYTDDEATAKAAFDMLLALDPGHFLSYTLSPKATFVFEKVRQRSDRTSPELDVTWDHGGKVGAPVPIGVEVLADPKHFLRRASVFVRERGAKDWRAADLTLRDHGEQRLVLPAVQEKKPASLELYLKAYDDRGNEVLTWSDATRPREIALRYDAPQAWYRTWWGISAIGVAVAAIAGVTVYEVTLAPPEKVGGMVVVK